LCSPNTDKERAVSDHLLVESEGPLSVDLAEVAPFGPTRRLNRAQLLSAQMETLASPRRRPSLSARALFGVMDLAYGRTRTLDKFRVLEVVARVPYQAWEHVAYVALTHTARRRGLARRVFEQVRLARRQQDNEQWHLLILEELTEGASTGNGRLGWFRYRVLPQVMAFSYYQLSWLMYAIRPDWSYRLNADFEDHAEHEYALFVQEHPELETGPYAGDFADEYGRFDSVADLLRQIGFDERMHKEESIARMKNPRFA
jgi:ubiquinol oxidase